MGTLAAPETEPQREIPKGLPPRAVRAQPTAATAFQWSIVAAGAVVVAAAFLRPGAGLFDLRFLILTAVTVALGSRISIKIPGAQGKISVSDTFVFLAVLLFGLESAVLLAAAESFFSSRRFCKKRIT